MPEGNGGIAATAPSEPPSCPARRFDVPEYMVPKSIAEIRELARLIALAEWAPDSYRDLDGNYIQQKIELAIMHGATVGLGPIAAVQSIAVIEGMPTIWGDGALSIVERSGLLEDMLDEYELHPEEGLTAICTMRRRRRPTPIQNRFSLAMAEHAHLLQKEGPWQLYPQRMLKMRARSWTIRDGFADVLRGLHIREEVDDFIETRGGWPGLGRSGQSPLPILRPRRPSPQTAEVAATVPEPETTAAAGIPNAAETSAAGMCGAAVPETPAVTPEAVAAQDWRVAAEPTVAHRNHEESFTLADAEGSFLEVAGTEALRSEFERLFSEQPLSSDQILGLWESNEPAREAIERFFGNELLEPVAERVRSAQAARRPQPSRTDQEESPPATADGPSPERHPADPPCLASGLASTPPRPLRRTRKTPAQADPELVVTLGRGWGDHKVFRHYRAALVGVHTKSPGEPSEITRFRKANAALETRLRTKLPDRMAELDFLYGRPATPQETP